MNKIFARFNDPRNAGELSQLCTQLIAEQNNSWMELRQAYELLKDVRVRELCCEGFMVCLQHNAGRMINSLASVNQEDIKERQCFLCAENLPPEQKGIIYRDEFMILCNPRPVFHSHLTVSHIHHRLQAIAGNIDRFLQIVADFGPGWAVLYNGPQCGASAPDHLHFQAVPSGKMPIEKVVVDEKKLTLVAVVDGIRFSRVRNVGREIVILEGNNRVAVGNIFKKFHHALKKILDRDGEPMMNIAGLYEGDQWRLMIFPRAKHRPNPFFMEGDGRIVVSPAIIEMGGVIITPMERDFERLDQSIVEGIFREVSLDAATVDRALYTFALSQ